MSVESGYAASQKAALNQHVEAVHKIIRIRNHVCGMCGHADSQKGSLEMPIKQVHLKIRSLFWGSKATFFTTKVSNFQMYLFNVYLQATFLWISISTLSKDILMIICTALTCWLNAPFSSERLYIYSLQTWFFFLWTVLIWLFRVPFLRQQSHILHNQGF